MNDEKEVEKIIRDKIGGFIDMVPQLLIDNWKETLIKVIMERIIEVTPSN